MTKQKYKEKCKSLFEKAESLGLELKFSPEDYDCRRLNCLWYGGELAGIKVSEGLSIELDVYGDVYASLSDKNGNVIAYVKDKNNAGAFNDEMLPYLKTDKQLKTALNRGLLQLDYGNWVEYDGVIKKSAVDERGEFVDLGIVCDNVLEDNILDAIDSALDAYENIVQEILSVAERNGIFMTGGGV